MLTSQETQLAELAAEGKSTRHRRDALRQPTYYGNPVPCQNLFMGIDQKFRAEMTYLRAGDAAAT